MKALTHSPPAPLPKNSRILGLHPFLGKDGLLHVGGRLSHSSLSINQHPIIVASQDHFVKLLLSHEHVRLAHCGPTLLLSSVGEMWHVIGARRAARTVCSQCIPCRKVAAAGTQQRMGQLPEARVTPSHPFTHTGIDYAGPFQSKLGRVRKPVFFKAYVAVFVCLTTKSVHLEVVSDATTEGFLAALRRFISRRGLPRDVYSDHGSNFRGAAADLKALYQMLEQEKTLISSFLMQHKIQWYERASHFGGSGRLV